MDYRSMLYYKNVIDIINAEKRICQFPLTIVVAIVSMFYEYLNEDRILKILTCKLTSCQTSKSSAEQPNYGRIVLLIVIDL